jgi:hypothetical protein
MGYRQLGSLCRKGMGYGVWVMVVGLALQASGGSKSEGTQTRNPERGQDSEVNECIQCPEIVQTRIVTRTCKHARGCRQPRSHTLRRESHEERGSVNYEGPLFGLATALPKEPHELEYSRIHGRQARREATRCSPKGLVGVSEDQVAGVQGCVIHVGVQGRWPRVAEARPSCIKERAWATGRASCPCMLSCRYVSWWCRGDNRARREKFR